MKGELTQVSGGGEARLAGDGQLVVVVVSQCGVLHAPSRSSVACLCYFVYRRRGKFG